MGFAMLVGGFLLRSGNPGKPRSTGLKLFGHLSEVRAWTPNRTRSRAQRRGLDFSEAEP